MVKGIAARTRTHRWQLLVVLGLCLAGQIMTLDGHVGAIVTGDSRLYLGDAQALVHGQWPPSGVPPGYSAVLALLGLVPGSAEPATVIFQVLVLISAALLTYFLVGRVTGRTWFATAAGGAVGGDYYLLQWERFVLTEALAAGLLVATLIALDHHLRSGTLRSALGAGLLAGAVALVHSSLVGVPIVVIAIAVLAPRTNRLTRATVVTASSLGVLAAVAVFNGLNTGYYALSRTASGNLLGKLIEYQMQNETDDPKYAVIATLLKPETQPVGVLDRHPELNATPADRALLSQYVHDVVSANIVQFTELSLRDTAVVWIAPPIAFAQPATGTVPVARATRVLSEVVAASLPFAALMSIWCLRLGRRRQGWMLAALIGCSVASFVVIGFDGYTEQTRLRSPADWTTLIAVVIAASEFTAAMKRRQLQAQDRTGASQESTPLDDAPTPTPSVDGRGA